MRVLLVGDVHEKISELNEYLIAIKSMFKIEAAIQVGDFGFFPKVFRQMSKNKIFFPVPLYVIDGNHEDHLWLYKDEEESLETRYQEWRELHNLFFQARGSSINIDGSKIGFLGGALNVDRHQNHSLSKGISNFIQKKQRISSSKLFNKEKIDLLITHTGPANIGVGMRAQSEHHYNSHVYIKGAGFAAGEETDCGDLELMELWRSLDPKPKAWVFGHFHFFHEKKIDQTLFVSLDQFKDRGSHKHIVFWDTSEKNLILIKN